MKKINKSIVNRLAKKAGNFGIICGNVQTDTGAGVAIVGAYYGFAIVGDRPENTPDDNNADRAQGFYNNNIAAARMSCTKQLATPDFKALQMYDRTERKAKTNRPFNWGAGMPAVNPQFLTDILSLDKHAKIYYNKPNAVLYIAGNGFEAVLMPVKKPKDRPDIATDLTEYSAEPTAEPQTAEPETVTPWYLRDDANGDATPIPWDVYTAAQTEPETEPEPEKPETRPLNYTIARISPAGNVCNFAAYATMSRATANIIDFSRMYPNYKFKLYRHGTFYKRYEAGKEIANDRYAQIAREMERAKNAYQPPKPSEKESIIAATAGIFADKVKIVKVGA
jgi:hypothetical protein